MDLQAPDEEPMIQVAVADLNHRFVSIDRSRIEERHAREELQQVGTDRERNG